MQPGSGKGLEANSKPRLFCVAEMLAFTLLGHGLWPMLVACVFIYYLLMNCEPGWI